MADKNANAGCGTGVASRADGGGNAERVVGASIIVEGSRAFVTFAFDRDDFSDAELERIEAEVRKGLSKLRQHLLMHADEVIADDLGLDNESELGWELVETFWGDTAFFVHFEKLLRNVDGGDAEMIFGVPIPSSLLSGGDE